MALRRVATALLVAGLITAQTAQAEVTLNFVNADIDQVAKAIGAATGKTIIVDAARTFHIVAECDLGEDTIASPAAVGGNLYIRTRGNLYRIGSK